MSEVWGKYVVARQKVVSTEAKFLVQGRGILSTLAYRVVVPALQATEACEPVRQPYATESRLYPPVRDLKFGLSYPAVSIADRN